MKNINKFFPVLFILVLCIIYFWPIFVNPDKILHGQDIWTSYYWKAFIRDELFNYRLPLWNPFDRTGFPNFANPAMFIWYPFNLLFVLLPIYLASNLSFFIHVLISGIFTYLFARSLKLSIIPSLTASVCFAFFGYLPMRIYSGHREIIESIAFIPVVFFFLHKYFTSLKIKFLVLGGLFLGIQFFAAYPAIVVYTLEAALIFVFLMPCKTLLFRLTSFAKLVLLGLGIASIQLIPFLELSLQITRNASYSFEQSTLGSFPPAHFTTFIFPFAFGNPLTGSYTGAPTFWELGFYPGLATLILFMLAFFGLKKNLYLSRTFLIIAFIMILLALGSNNPLYKIIWDLNSFYQKTRVPARQLFLFAFSISLMAGIGSQFLKKKWLQITFLFLIILDLFSFGKKFIKMEDPKIYLGDQKLFAKLTEDKSLFRVYPVYDLYSPMRLSVSEFNTPTIYGIASVKAYNPYILKTYHDFINSIEQKTTYGEVDVPLTNISSNTLNFLNIKYFLTPPERNLDKEDYLRFKKILETPYYKLFENKNSLPRFFFEDKEIVGKIEVKKYLPNEVVLEVEANKDTQLMSSEIYYPGWHALVDGEKGDFTLIYETFRGTKISKGVHEVKWYFLPYSLIIGGTISFFTVILSVVFLHFRNEHD